MSAPARAGTGGSSNPLPVGTVVAGRFRIQGFLRSEGGTDVYQAIDSQGGGAVLLRLLSEAPTARAVLEADLAKAARLDHKNLTHVAAVGDYAGMLFLAAEVEDGHTLRELIEAQRAQGKTIGLAYARTLLGHVANGLEGAAQAAMPHGALNPACIWITRAGRVKVSDLGLARGLPALARRGGPPGAPEGLYVAPEVTRGAGANTTSDVYSLGAILYELVTGLPPAQPLRTPSQVATDLPAAVDAVIGKALSPQTHARFTTPGELIAALASAAGDSSATAASTGGAAPRISLGRSFDVAQAAGMTDSDERWLIQKDRLDYGPFSLAQLMAQIERGAFGADHLIVDIDSGERQKVKDHPMLGAFALDAERRLEVVRRARAEEVHVTVERKKSRATFVIVGTAVLAVGIGLTVYLLQRGDAHNDELASRIGEGDVDEFLKNVRLNFTPQKKTATAHRPASGGGKDDFNTATSLGDVTQSGGDDVLSNDRVQQVMMGNYRKLIPCIMQERHRNPGLNDIEVEFVVLGSGKVSAVRVNGQRNGSFPGCVLGRMQSFGFPSFNGKKTVASWSLSMR
jgi:protein kinase-like protein